MEFNLPSSQPEKVEGVDEATKEKYDKYIVAEYDKLPEILLFQLGIYSESFNKNVMYFKCFFLYHFIKDTL